MNPLLPPRPPGFRFPICHLPFAICHFQISNFKFQISIPPLRRLALCCALLFAFTIHGLATVLPGHVPGAVALLQPLGRLPASQHLTLAIGLPLRNQAELDRFLHELYDPASPNYHRYLTTQQFTDRFGPTPQDYQSVIDFAKANHLRVTATHPNRLILDVDGAAADLEKTFHVALYLYQHPTEPRTFYAPDTEPSLDLSTPILHIKGLDNYFLPKPLSLRRASNTRPGPLWAPEAGSGPNGNYLGDDFRAAYIPGTSLSGAFQTVGLLQFDGYNPNDITSYESQAGLPNVPLQNVLLNGFSGLPGNNNSEVCLDIEMCVAMAPGLSQIILYEAPNAFPGRRRRHSQSHGH